MMPEVWCRSDQQIPVNDFMALVALPLEMVFAGRTPGLLFQHGCHAEQDNNTGAPDQPKLPQSFPEPGVWLYFSLVEQWRCRDARLGFPHPPSDHVLSSGWDEILKESAGSGSARTSS
ncbi:MAG: hypothetical protein KJ070_18240 [Verrucomicrobia bacterium]|nr:hypothetical protein [Verrucomicrobiota bacterium]